MKTPGKTKDYANRKIAASLKPGKKHGFQTRERFSDADIQETADFTVFSRGVHVSDFGKPEKNRLVLVLDSGTGKVTGVEVKHRPPHPS